MEPEIVVYNLGNPEFMPRRSSGTSPLIIDSEPLAVTYERSPPIVPKPEKDDAKTGTAIITAPGQDEGEDSEEAWHPTLFFSHGIAH